MVKASALDHTHILADSTGKQTVTQLQFHDAHKVATPTEANVTTLFPMLYGSGVGNVIGVGGVLNEAATERVWGGGPGPHQQRGGQARDKNGARKNGKNKRGSSRNRGRHDSSSQQSWVARSSESTASFLAPSDGRPLDDLNMDNMIEPNLPAQHTANLTTLLRSRDPQKFKIGHTGPG